MSKIKFIYLDIWGLTPELKELFKSKFICYARGEDYSEFYYLEQNEQFIKNELLKSIPINKISMIDLINGVTICELDRVKKELGVC